VRRALPTLVAAIVVWGGLAHGVPARPGSDDDVRSTAVVDGDHREAAGHAVARKEARPIVPGFRSPGVALLGTGTVLAARVLRLRRTASCSTRPCSSVPSGIRRRGPPVGAAPGPSPAR
jgi:hypothetical protein